MLNRFVTTMAIAAPASLALAQPFIESVGEPAPPSEFVIESAEDLALFRSDTTGNVGGIVYAGEREGSFPVLGSQGLVVLTDPNGTPVRAWAIDHAGSQREMAAAVRQATVDNDLLVLELTDDDVPGQVRRVVVIKYDGLTGAQSYAWRYLGDAEMNPWGMELDGDTALFAGGVRLDNGIPREGLLVRFDQNTGLPLINFRYQPFNSGQQDLVFADVAVDREDGSIYATGRIGQGVPGQNLQERIVIAKFDQFGNPIWARGYLTLMEDETRRTGEGVSIEVTREGNVAITARTSGLAGDAAYVMLVDPLAGLPIVSRFLTDERTLVPAFASLDRFDDQSLLVSGTFRDADGAGNAVMWSMDQSTLALNWFYEDITGESIGQDAIVQPSRGLLLSGQTKPFLVDPMGNDRDALLLRTRQDGSGPCSLDDLPDRKPALVDPFDIPLEQIQLPTPLPEQPAIVSRNELEQNICDQINDCVADFDNDGDVDLGDFGVFGAAFGSMLGDANYNPAADFDMDGDVDLGDFGIFGAEFGRMDCL